MQFHAGSKFPSTDMGKLKPGGAVLQARPLESSMMDRTPGEGEDKEDASKEEEGGLRRVYPFTLSPQSALKRGLDVIR